MIWTWCDVCYDREWFVLKEHSRVCTRCGKEVQSPDSESILEILMSNKEE